MSDLSIGTVVNLTPITKRTGPAGAAITAGESVYLLNGKWYPAQATTKALSGYGSTVGIALTAQAVVGSNVTVAIDGDVDLGVSVTAGTIYVISAANLGGIAPWADLGGGNFVTILGVGNSSEVLSLGTFPSGVAHA